MGYLIHLHFFFRTNTFNKFPLHTCTPIQVDNNKKRASDQNINFNQIRFSLNYHKTSITKMYLLNCSSCSRGFLV